MSRCARLKNQRGIRPGGGFSSCHLLAPGPAEPDVSLQPARGRGPSGVAERGPSGSQASVPTPGGPGARWVPRQTPRGHPSDSREGVPTPPARRALCPGPPPSWSSTFHQLSSPVPEPLAQSELSPPSPPFGVCTSPPPPARATRNQEGRMHPAPPRHTKAIFQAHDPHGTAPTQGHGRHSGVAPPKRG